MSKQRRSQPVAASPEVSWAQSVASAAASTYSVDSNAAVTTRTTTERGWSWAIASLAQPLDNDRKCNVSIADSIALPSDLDVAQALSISRKGTAASKSVLWLTTHKSGAIARKRLKHTSGDTSGAVAVFPAAEISERFVRLASRWAALGGAAPSHSPPYIAVLVLRDGERQLLEPAAFQTWLDALEASSAASASQRNDAVARVAGLQAYIPPARGSAPSFVTATYSATAASPQPSTNSSGVSVAYRDAYCASADSLAASQSSDALPPQATRLRKEVERATLAVVDALQRASSSRMYRVSLEFVIDCEHRLWLTHVARIAVASVLERQDETSSSEHAAALGLRNQSLPTLHAASTGGAAAAAALSNGDMVGTKCRGEFCHTAPAQLPGLFRTSLTGSGADSDNNNTHADALPDTGQRFKIGYNNIQLAHAEMRFLLGTDTAAGAQATAETRRELALRWQEADNVLRTELGRSNPTQFYRHVLVCTNCYRVYSELNRVRDSGFRDPGDVTPRGGGTMKQSRSTTALKTTTTTAKLRGKAALTPPETSSELFYDQLFLAELAKHDTLTSTSADATDSDAVRPELEDANCSRPPSSSSSRSERASLPSLQPPVAATVAALPRTKKSKILSGTGPPTATTVRSSNNNQAPGGSSDDDAQRSVSAALTARVAKLEDELTQTRAALTASESQRQQLEQRCVQTQTQCTAMLAEKDDAMRKQRLELELACSSAKQTRWQQQQQQREAGAGAASPSAADEIRKLLETIDSLSAQISALEATKDRDAKTQTQTHQLEVKRLHERYQVEMEALRLSEHAAKEQVEAAQLQLLNAQHAAQVAATQARSARAALDDLTASTLAPLEEKNRRLERQITELQAAMAQQQRKPSNSSTTATTTASGSALGAPSPSVAVSVSPHELEALEKHMGHKVEYLKAQLASEMKCKEELGHHLAQVTSALEAAKRDKRQALAEQDEAFKRQLTRVESGFASERDVLAAQHAALQGKVATLHANAADLVQDVTLWKSKEANAKLALDKMADESIRQARQIADLEAHVEALLDERRHDSSSGGGGTLSAKSANDETQRMQTEALLRRLDNERQYLKNQLDAEIDAREHNQRQATALQSDVATLQAQLEQVTSDAETARSAAAADAQRAERQARDAIECLDESKRLLAKQLSDVQSKWALAREQALLDRDELEKLRIDANELRAQLAAASDELTRERAHSQSTSARSSQALALARDSLRAVETESALRVQRLEHESALLVEQLANTQAELLVVEDRRSADVAALKRQHALIRLALTVRASWSRHCALLRCRAFHTLVLQSRQRALRAALDSEHSAALSALDEQLRREFMDKCDELAQRLHDERLDAEKLLRARHRDDCDALHERLQREITQQLDDAAHAHARELRALRDTHAAAVSALESRVTETLAQAQMAHEDAETSHMATSTMLAETRQQCDLLRAELEALAAAASHESATSAAQYANERLATQRAHEQQLADAAEVAAAHIDKLQHAHKVEVQTLAEAHALELAERVEQTEVQAREHEAAAIKTLAAAHAEELTAATVHHDTLLRDETQRVTTQWQREVADERARGEQMLQDALARSERKAAAALEALQRELGERKGQAIVQCTAKWQRAVEELQARLDAETQAAYARGVQDRENEWQRAAAQIKQTQQQELSRVENEALRAVRAAEERHALQLQAQLAAARHELEAAHTQALAQMQLEHDARTSQLTQQLQTERLESEQTLTALQTSHADALAVVAADHERALAVAHSESQCALDALREALTLQTADALARAAAAHELALAVAADEAAAQAQHAQSQLRDALARDHEAQIQQLRESLERDAQAQLAALETRLVRAQDDAVAHVQDDAERLIAQVEHAMATLKAHKDALERELATLRSALETADDAHFDATEQLAMQRKRAALHVLAIVARAMQRLASDRATHAQTQCELQQQIDGLTAASLREREHQQCEYAALRTHWQSVQRALSDMRTTLTAFKREELVAHRSASGVLATELTVVRQQLAEVAERKAALEREIEALQADAARVEASLRELLASSASAASTDSGALNVAVAAKKRRLNDEFEALLERAERKRQEVRGVDATLAALHARRDAKELEMKGVERALVEILVQQQKRLLALLAAARDLPLPASLASGDAESAAAALGTSVQSSSSSSNNTE